MAAELQRWRVLASRPRDQNKAWRARLESAGFTTLDVPLLAIVPVQRSAQQQRIKTIILDFDQYDAVIFVSQNAVAHTWQWLDQYWSQLPSNMHYFAVGQKTAEQIEALLLADNAGTVSAATAAMNSEELLALAPLQQVAHKKILICRGVGGRTTLGEQLQARGATVTYCELYERVLPEAAATQLATVTFNPEHDLLTVFSGETLHNLMLAMQQTQLALQSLPLLVPGERVAAQAAAEGFARVIVARNASESEMLNALTQFIQTSG